jgi:hypothetical protein
MRQPPTKTDIVKLVESCKTPGSKLAIALAAFSGLTPGQIRRLTLGRNVGELSLPRLKFVQMPARINLSSAPREETRRPFRFHRWYTFMSSRSGAWLLEDLKARSQQPVSAKSAVVTARSFREADGGVHVASFRWHDLQDFFAESFIRCFVTMGTGSVDLHFLLGHSIDENALTHVWRFFDPQRIEWMRAKYARVEKRFFA